MQNENVPVIGIAYSDDKNFNFYIDDHSVTFMCTDQSNIQLHGPFVFGHTFGYKNIAIFKGKDDISFQEMKKFNTSAYIIASYNGLGTQWSTFDYIEFKGGTLNQLFCCNALVKETLNNGTIQLYQNNDSLRYKFQFNGHTCEIVVGSGVHEQFGFEGMNISNNEAHLLLKFEVPQPLESAFNYISNIINMLSIMLFRKNVGFDEIYLHHNEKNLSKMQVFLKKEDIFSKKKLMSNITFSDLGMALPKLASIVFNSEDKKPAYEIGFYPCSDKDIHFMTNDKVRLICSALECELSFFNNSCIPEEQHLKELIDDIKQRIKLHKKSEKKLSPKTYDLIFSNLRNWSLSASDRIIKLFHQYEREITALEDLMQNNVRISDDDILELIKFRNNITHGSYRIIDQKIATTAFLLQGLVYCCLLKRIGMNNDEILYLCQNRKILS